MSERCLAYFHKIVLADTLNQQESARLLARIRYLMNRWRSHGGELSGKNLMTRPRVAGLHNNHPFKPVVIVGNLGVPVPRNCFAWIERVLAHKDIGAFRDDVNGAHFVRLGFCLAHEFFRQPIRA